jgi:hypothetical protein
MSTWEIDPQLLRLAGRGFRLFPVQQKGKQPLISDWPHKASFDLQTLSHWYQRFPGCNRGAATGKESGFFVLDVDGESGLAAISSLCEDHGYGWTETLAVRTARGGHLYFKWSEHAAIRNSAGKLDNGLDIRGEGGYVVVPPSEHETGCRYEWIGGGAEVEIADAPDWLIEKLTDTPPIPDHQAEPATTIPQGRRNATLFSLAGTLRSRAMSRAAIEAALRTENEQRCQPPLAEEEVRQIVDSVWRYSPSKPDGTQDRAEWPQPLPVSAFYGLAGEIVRAIEPHTEADTPGLLVQLLVAAGNTLGRGPHFRAEADRHGLNLFAVLVGATAKGRKGTSLGHIQNLVAGCDPVWAQSCVKSGLSSGEGLIYHVRDPLDDDDAGIEDKRLQIVETEFASTLRVLQRDGNTLSPILRIAWDGTPLATLTKQSPCKATGAHISVIAHVTKDELKRELTRTDAGSGFGNRFLFVCVKRSKCLPDGGRLLPENIAALEARLSMALEHGRDLGDYELKRDPEATALWHSVYAALSEGKPGLLGAVTSRAEAQVMRIACMYAILDCAKKLRVEHMSAALAVWAYCEASAKFIFGTALGHPLADTILRFLRENPDGLTRSELSARLSRNQTAADIDNALSVLAEHGLAQQRREQTNGRTSERWIAVGV